LREFEKQDEYPASSHSLKRFFRGQEKLKDLRVEQDMEKALNGIDAVIFAVRHKHYLNLDPDEVVRNAGGPIAVIDCFGILDDSKIRRYFKLGCEVKGLGRGHVKRIKDQVREKREQLLLDISLKGDKLESRLESENVEMLNGAWKLNTED
jgi:UDP-N-acetyl-D-glucosamine dehydrogenase